MPRDSDVRKITPKLLFLLVFTHPENRQKRLLRNIDLSDPLHPLFAFFLLP